MDLFSSISNQDDPSFVLIAFAVLLAFLLSSLLVFTYEKTSRDIVPPDHFLQAIVLMAIVTTMIMESIGDSLARGFGIFGALAVLRFRTNIFNPRNVAFLFGAMAIGITCGVNSFANGIIGTVAFCIIAFILRLTPYGRKNNLLGELRFELEQGPNDFQKIENMIRDVSKTFVLKRYRINYIEQKGDVIEYSFELRLQDEMNGLALTKNLQQIPGVQNVRLTFNDTYVHQTD